MRVLACLLLLVIAWPVRTHGPSAIPWQRDDHAAFATARNEGRFVLLYLEAVWCHWCHVMDEKTYGDPRVRDLLASHYVPLRIDQDLRPDLANRYRDWGWPATIVFAPDGREIVKRQGYVPPDAFARLLQAIVDDPSPEAAARLPETVPVAPVSSLDPGVRATLLERHHATFDEVLGGLRTRQKYLDRDQVEYALSRPRDALEARIAARSLAGAAGLLDPAFGGVYQYSTGGDWKHPHYEKLTRLQAEYLRVYSLACAQAGRERDCRVANGILNYLRHWQRSAEGAYRASQDADLVPGQHASDYFALSAPERLRRGAPRVDPGLYAAENGLVIEALALRAEWIGDTRALADARRAADWAIRHRGLPEGGFRHDAEDRGGPFLADTLAMGRGLLALYRATGDRDWLARAAAAGDFLIARFRAPAGFHSAQAGQSPIAPPVALDEVLATGRFLNLLAHYSGNPVHAEGARHALGWLGQRTVALSRMTDAGILLLDDQINQAPLHVVVVGAKGDPAARDLFAAIARIPEPYKRIEWWDRAEGDLMHHDVAYPKLKRAAAFVCTDRTCSLPLTDATMVRDYLERQDTAEGT